MSETNSIEIVPAVNSEEELITAVNDYHTKILKRLSSARSYYIQIGIMLTQAKKEYGHGNWEDWVKKNLDFSTRSASSYIRYSKQYKELSKSEASSDLDSLPLPNLKLLENKQLNVKTKRSSRSNGSSNGVDEIIEKETKKAVKPISKLKDITKARIPGKRYDKALNTFNKATDGNTDMDSIGESFSTLLDASNEINELLEVESSCLDKAISYIEELEEYINSM